MPRQSVTLSLEGKRPTITRQIRLAALRRLVFKIMANAQRCHFTIASYREKGLELPSRALMRTRSEHASGDSCSTCAARADSNQEILVMSGLVRYSKLNGGYTYTPPTRTIFYINAGNHQQIYYKPPWYRPQNSELSGGVGRRRCGGRGRHTMGRIIGSI